MRGLRSFGLLALGLVACLVFGAADGIVCNPTPPEEPVCQVPADCDGLPELDCPGSWACLEGACVWQCDSGPDYTLHEWGVFKTGGAGADVTTTPVPYVGPVPAKPIIYLYANEAFSLDVQVDFASGGATEVWPEITMGQSIAWDGIQVAATNQCTTTPFPTVDPNDFELPPEVSQLGDYVVDAANCLSHGDTDAKLLFYTGTLPDYQVPLEMTWTIDESGEILTATLDNAGNETVEHVMIVWRAVDDECIDPSGCWINYAALAHGLVDLVQPGQSVTIDMPILHLKAETDNGWGQIDLPTEWTAQADTLEARLLAMGLSAAEADAFMVAWENIFFGLESSASQFFEPEYENGMFLIYPISEATYDEQLTLSLSHEPVEMVRTGFIYHKVPTQACLPAQEFDNGECTCKDNPGQCYPWCDPADPDCTPGTWNDLTCTCDPADGVY